MKKKLCNVASVVGFLMVLTLTVNYVTGILSRKDSAIKYHDLESEERGIDVMFFGTSHVVNGIYPMELWNEYGIVSYNCGGHGNQIPTTYWVMRNVFDNCVPKLVVVDVFGLESNDRIRPERPGIDQQHISFDWIDLSRNKIEMMNYLFDDIETKIEFLFPISIYHDRWSEVGESDFVIDDSVHKGAEYRANRAAPIEIQLIDRNEREEANSLGKVYLCKMIEECQSRGIEVLLINIPYPAVESQQRWANSVDLIAEQYGVNYLNLQYEDTGINFFSDMYDNNSHLNPSGARKITSYVGEYIVQHYEVSDWSQNMAYADWHDTYSEYALYKWDVLRGKKGDLGTYLSLLADDNLDICLFYNGDSEMIYWGTPPRLVKNLTELKEFQQASDERKDYFTVIDHGADCVYEYLGENHQNEIMTSFATVSYGVRDENGIRSMTINEEERNYLLNEDGTMAEIAIVSFDKNTGEMVDWVRFNRNVSVSGK